MTISLGTLLVSLFGFALAFPIAAIGHDLWDSDKRGRGVCCLLVGVLLGIQGTLGLLGFDLWSLWKWN
jgi:hypothetical protein